MIDFLRGIAIEELPEFHCILDGNVQKTRTGKNCYLNELQKYEAETEFLQCGSNKDYASCHENALKEPGVPIEKLEGREYGSKTSAVFQKGAGGTASVPTLTVHKYWV